MTAAVYGTSAWKDALFHARYRQLLPPEIFVDNARIFRLSTASLRGDSAASEFACVSVSFKHPPSPRQTLSSLENEAAAVPICMRGFVTALIAHCQQTYSTSNRLIPELQHSSMRFPGSDALRAAAISSPNRRSYQQHALCQKRRRVAAAAFLHNRPVSPLTVPSR